MNPRFEYKEMPTGRIAVKLDHRVVGYISEVEGGFQYMPKGQKKGGDVYPDIHKCKRSIEYGDDAPTDTTATVVVGNHVVSFNLEQAAAMMIDEEEIIALNEGAYLAYLALGIELLNQGHYPIAKVVKGYSTEEGK